MVIHKFNRPGKLAGVQMDGTNIILVTVPDVRSMVAPQARGQCCLATEKKPSYCSQLNICREWGTVLSTLHILAWKNRTLKCNMHKSWYEVSEEQLPCVSLPNLLPTSILKEFI